MFAQIQPILATYCENIFHVGGPGAGHIVKLLNNFVAQAICTATAEAFTVGAKAGIDPAELVKVISAGPVNNGLFQAMAKTLGGDFAGLKFELDNARKDLRYYTHLAEMVNVPSFVGEAVHQSLATCVEFRVWQRICAVAGEGAGEADWDQIHAVNISNLSYKCRFI